MVHKEYMAKAIMYYTVSGEWRLASDAKMPNVKSGDDLVRFSPRVNISTRLVTRRTYQSNQKLITNSDALRLAFSELSSVANLKCVMDYGTINTFHETISTFDL
jgi:hypothetical protein